MRPTVTRLVTDPDVPNGLLAYCTDDALLEESKAELEMSNLEFNEFQPLFCVECRKMLGFYDPEVEPEVQNQLQHLVDEAYSNAVKNNYKDFVDNQELSLVAQDLMDGDAAIEELVAQNNLRIQNVEHALLCTRMKNQ